MRPNSARRAGGPIKPPLGPWQRRLSPLQRGAQQSRVSTRPAKTQQAIPFRRQAACSSSFTRPSTTSSAERSGSFFWIGVRNDAGKWPRRLRCDQATSSGAPSSPASQEYRRRTRPAVQRDDRGRRPGRIGAATNRQLAAMRMADRRGCLLSASGRTFVLFDSSRAPGRALAGAWVAQATVALSCAPATHRPHWRFARRTADREAA
jgi:hypothetical protein